MTNTVATLTYQEPIATGGNREDLGNIIFDVSPTETPVLSAIGRNRAKATSHDYLTDELAAPDTAGAIEGADAAPTRPASRTRLSNFTQIFERSAAVSGTQEKVLKGGSISSEMNYQILRRGQEMKNSVESAIVGVNKAKLGGDETTARLMGSLSTYLDDDSYQGAGTPPTGNGVDVPAAGTGRAFTKDILRDALDVLWTQSSGNKNVMAVCAGAQRKLFSEFSGTDTRYVTTDDRELVDSIDVFDGDYHTVTVTPDRFCLANNVFIIDKEYLKLSELRTMATKDLAVVGDSVRKQIIWETTLEVCSPKAHINIADLL